MTHFSNDRVLGFNGGAALKLVPKEPMILDEQTLNTKQLKTLSTRLKELVAMLAYARPHGSDTELNFIARYIDTLPNVHIDAYGNRIVKIGKEQPSVCFTSHTDTVHYDEGIQAIALNSEGHLALDLCSQASCLGADCTAGVWLMRRMILAGKKGLYIFHRAEESGGQGSSWIADNTPELVANIKAIISLDRKGYDSVITEQYMGVTASDSFARSLGLMLPKGFKPDPTGSFTDSAFYAHLIPECTNLSIGYEHCHTYKETLDFRFTDMLLGYLLKLDYDQLIITRDPTVETNYYYGSYAADKDAAWNEYMCSENDPYEIDPVAKPPNSGLAHNKRKYGYDNDTSNPLFYDHNLASVVSRYPESVALLLGQLGVNELDIYEVARELGL